MQVKDFDYNLPQKLIAQKPCRPRDYSRLMILNKKNKKIIHDRFYNIHKYLKSNDVLVANNSRVIPARLFGNKQTGGKIEILLLKQINKQIWEIIIKGSVKQNTQINFNKTLNGVLIKHTNENTWHMKFNLQENMLNTAINKIGIAPTPPYIKRISNLKEYQTIYSQSPGSVAAPTAGFHFTKPLMKKIKQQGISFEFVTLHVGLGTFQPIRVNNIKKHKIHRETAQIDPNTAQILNKYKQKNKNIIAVGTTTTRTLESFCVNKKLLSGIKSVNLFIYPGYKFKFINGLITNFHLPKSTLLMLVCAFANTDFVLYAYKQAVKNKYKFYSFGDAMLII